MSPEGVMVSYDHSAETAEGPRIVSVAGSGTRWGRWVLCAGALLAPVPPPPRPNDEYYATLPPVVCWSARGPEAVTAATGRVRHVWRCPRLDRLTHTQLAPWTVAHRIQDHTHQGTVGRDLLAVFVLIDLDIHDTGVQSLRPLSELYDLVGPPPSRGDLLEVHSTPFGCEVFLNSVTRGGVCAALGGELLLSDVAAALGSEGGPVYSRGKLVGVVVSAVSWWRGEWAGLTLVAPLQTLLATKLRLTPTVPREPPLTSPRLAALDAVDRTVVLVRCGAAWGAGIYVGAGLFLTCAHVVQNSGASKVTVYGLGVSERAIVRYQSAPDAPFDLALVYSNQERWRHLRAAEWSGAVVVGEAVWAAGFPFFTERDVEDVRPVLTAGHVTAASPHMVTTSCCVQSGFSGGGIFRVVYDVTGETGETGEGARVEVVGVVVSNARSEAGAVFPHVNMVVPSTAFSTPLSEYLAHRDISKLEVLQHHKEPVLSQWRLMPYRSKV